MRKDFAGAVVELMRKDAPTCNMYIVGFDQRPPSSFFIPKQVHTDSEREKTLERAAKKRQKRLDAMSKEEREQEVIELDVANHDPNRKLPQDWAWFIGKRENRWRVFQILVETLLDPRFIQMPVGKTLVVQGLPLRQGPLIHFDGHVAYGVSLVEENITQLHIDADPELFSRCLWIRGHQERYGPPVTLYMNWVEWNSRTWEADLLPVHFYKFLRNQNWMVYSNDRDMLLTLLLHSMDRRRPGSEEFEAHMCLWMPNKSKKIEWKGDFYVDINELYRCIENDDDLGPQVYNKVLTYVFVVLLTGCDHVRRDMFVGITTPTILKCLYDNASNYSHMVQLSNLLIPDPTAIRIPLVDERAVIDFASRVYLIKYEDLIKKDKEVAHEKAVRKAERDYARAKKAWEKNMPKIANKRERYRIAHLRNGGSEATLRYPDNLRFPPEPVMQEVPPLDLTVTRADIRERTSGYKDKRKVLPKREFIRAFVREAEMALIYGLNGGRDQTLFELGGLFYPAALSEDGVTPYWGYEADPARPGLFRRSDFVYEKQDLVTFRYPQNYVDNLWTKKRQKMQRIREIDDDVPVSPLDYQRKRSVGASIASKYMDLIK